MNDDGSLALSPEEAVAVAETATAFAAAVPAERAAPYHSLAASATDGDTVPAEHLETLERVCALALETGKARQIGRAEAERLLTAVFRRTPTGQALAAETSDVNRALAQLTGRTLEAARVTWRMPGRYYLNLTVGGVELTLAIEPEGLRAQSLQTG